MYSYKIFNKNNTQRVLLYLLLLVVLPCLLLISHNVSRPQNDPKILISKSKTGIDYVALPSQETIQSTKKPKLIKYIDSNNTRQGHIWESFLPSVDEDCFLEPHHEYNTEYFPEEDLGFLKTEEGKQYKTILAYYYAFGGKFEYGLGRKPFKAACCKEKRCFMTTKRNIIPMTDFDAVLIHYINFYAGYLPKNRSGHQRYIFFNQESPAHSPTLAKSFKGVYNWTMTYRKDSDVFAGYGYVYPKEMFSTKNFSRFERETIPLQILMKIKTKMAAWLVSHCSTSSKREVFVKNLQKYITVDIYGNCGPYKCHPSDRDVCYRWFENNYKFYISFENSLCTDYITEKFFNLLNYNIIPVVRGSGDYASVAPPHSYIDVRDFKSEKELAQFLLYLDKNDTAYMEYFKWKEDFFIVEGIGFKWIMQALNFCNLCEKLHSSTGVKVYHDLEDWFVKKGKYNST